MKEKDITAQIRKKMLELLGVPLTKFHGSAFTESGVSDLFGCLQGGRAIFVEVKAPGEMPKEGGKISELVQRQLNYLKKREELGAFTMMTDSWLALERKLRDEGVLK